MLDVVLMYVNAPDHVGGTEPRISTPDFVGSTLFDVRAAEETHAKSAPSVTPESSESLRLLTPETMRRSDSWRCVFMRLMASIWGIVIMFSCGRGGRPRARAWTTARVS